MLPFMVLGAVTYLLSWYLPIRPERRRQLCRDAIRAKNMEMLRWLAEHGLTTEDCIFDDCQLLDEAVQAGAGIDVLEWFESMGLTIDHVQSSYDQHSLSPILSHACKTGNTAVVEWLCRKGFTLHGISPAGDAIFKLIIGGKGKEYHPRMLTCIYQMWPAASWALEQPMQRERIFLAMVDLNNVHVMRWLLDMGIIFSNREIIALIRAFADGKIELFEMVYNDPRMRTQELRNQIVQDCSLAIRYGGPFTRYRTAKSLRWLLNRGFDLQDCCKVEYFRYAGDMASLELFAQMGMPQSKFAEHLWRPLSSRILVIIAAERRREAHRRVASSSLPRRGRLPPEIWQMVLEFIPDN